MGQWGGVGREGPFWTTYIPHVAKAEQGASRFPTQVRASFFSSRKECHVDCQVVGGVGNALMRLFSPAGVGPNLVIHDPISHLEDG